MANRLHSAESPGADGSTEVDPSLARLFQDHNASLIQLLRARLRSDQEARDVAQEAYVKLLQLDQLNTISYLRAYLFRTALNLAANRLQHGVIREAAYRDPVFDIGVDEISPERAVIAREELDAVSSALRDLPPKVRAAFLLHRFENLDPAGVARRIGVSERMVRKYIVQALHTCQQVLSRVRAETKDKGEGL